MTPTRALGPWAVVLGLVTSACALAGYDFGDYERAAAAPGPGAEGGSAGAAPAENENENEPVAPFAAAYGEGGDHDPGSAPSGAAGAAEICGACQPRGCLELGVERCGVTDDGCGAPLDCGGCFWWFQECRQNVCEIP